MRYSLAVLALAQGVGAAQAQTPFLQVREIGSFHVGGRAHVRAVAGILESRALVARDRDVRPELLHRTADHAVRDVQVVMTGLALISASAAVRLTGVDVAHFWLTLVLLGLGWNFSFVGASALVLECHRPEEKTRVQSFNDFAVFGTMAFGPFLSGALLTSYGWNTVLWLSFVPLAVAIAALTVTPLYRPQPTASKAGTS
jgi:MFS family permease